MGYKKKVKDVKKCEHVHISEIWKKRKIGPEWNEKKSLSSGIYKI